MKIELNEGDFDGQCLAPLRRGQGSRRIFAGARQFLDTMITGHRSFRRKQTPVFALDLVARFKPQGWIGSIGVISSTLSRLPVLLEEPPAQLSLITIRTCATPRQASAIK